MLSSPVIIDIDGLSLSQDEIAFFKDANPYGYILFERNIESPQQLRALTDSLKELAGTEALPILIDQEGGRVARMKPPHWPSFPSAKSLVSQGCGDVQATKDIIYTNAVKLGNMLSEVGITVNCAPVADIPTEDSDPIIGDRAYGTLPEQVAAYGDAMACGLMDAGVLPVLKHIPGHGRATVDSHITLPKVDTQLSVLESTDFRPFKALAHIPYAMTAHIVYSAIDAGACATFSREVIRYIREEIGYKGMIMSDALSMHALSGSPKEKATKALDAGCDLLLHCNGNALTIIADKEAVMQVAGKLDERVAEHTTMAFKGIAARQTKVA